MDTNINTESAQLFGLSSDTDVLTANEQLFKRLEPMALIGMAGSLLLALTDLGLSVEGKKSPLPMHRRRFLGGPIICHSRTRELQSHPLLNREGFKGLITRDRLKWVLGLTKLPVGPAEIAMVMYEASLEAPLNTEAAEIYLWGSSIAMYQLNPGNLEMLKTVHCKVAPDGDPERILDDPMIRLSYFDLANEIQRKVIANSKI